MAVLWPALCGRHGLAEVVVGADKRADELALGKELGIIDVAADTIEQAVSGSDLVVLAVPVRAHTGCACQHQALAQ